MQPITRSALVTLALGTVLGLTLLAPGAAPALAAGAADEQRGADLLTAVERGDADCAGLEDAEFDAIGEFAMGRMLGSSGAHEAIDETMTRMMGAAGLDRMHEAMGRRFAGCGASDLAGGYAGMMGMMQMMGGGMMGGPGGDSGSTTGFDRAADDEDDGPGAWMAIVMLVLIIGAGVAVFAIVRPTRGAPSAPLDVLAERFARGQMTAADYEQRRALLEGGDR